MKIRLQEIPSILIRAGGIGAGSVHAPGKSRLSRLQGELQKFHETGAELHNLMGVIYMIPRRFFSELSVIFYILTLVNYNARSH